MDPAEHLESASPLPDKSPSILPLDQGSTRLGDAPGGWSVSPNELKSCSWELLQEQFACAMEKHGNAEEDLRGQISKLLEVFMGWSQTTVVRDEMRASKRFKTQIQHVQNSEENLEKKRRHYVDVVKAFESALALLNDRIRL
ncbi:hypothetical protein BDV25DRAFT_30525 [Aspergillus avenaceus]|uniref:Uncharacterized protein n=1 Tax=Aspergillus avenaceus TaxID=36643 RepID=A0A5N6TN75_ASPAV|nr:hypothetical protein BDV25DRAFT_30525 [Aspergillus avenaceus]